MDAKRTDRMPTQRDCERIDLRAGILDRAVHDREGPRSLPYRELRGHVIEGAGLFRRITLRLRLPAGKERPLTGSTQRASMRMLEYFHSLRVWVPGKG